ncbi:hypothetical protein LCGC14_2166730 [marine sediment metagenome]|uniref:PD-(D/E)XK endonuclease-like domain-containing protein n=1 Tax=marine sediment metagenome TaxID=412755 RepID=A0A0F9G410_9ZZZZ
MVGQQSEARLVNRWLAKFHRTDPQWTRVRLGQVANHKEAKMYSVILRWADAVFLHDGKIHIVEGKLRPAPGAFGQLELYAELIKVTPEFSQYKSWHVVQILLTPIVDLNMVEQAKKKGILYEVFNDF